MSDEELIKRFERVEQAVRDAEYSPFFTTIMLTCMFIVFLIHGCDFK